MWAELTKLPKYLHLQTGAVHPRKITENSYPKDPN